MAIVINGSGTVTGLAVGGLPDGTVDEGTLANSSVVTAKLNDDAVTNAKMANDAITEHELAGSAVVTAAINDDAITAAKLASGVGGKVLQVVQETHNSEIQIGSNYTNLHSITITPTSASSKILVSITAGGMANAGDSIFFRLQRGSTTIWEHGRYGYTTTGWTPHAWVNQYLDSPNTTSAVTYMYSGKRGAAGDVRFTDLGSSSTKAGVAIAMEIGV